LPTYNRLAFLREAVQSVLRQTVSDWELIVVDDGSVDESVTWLESLGEPRLVLVRLAHSGNRSALRNVGMSRARAPWIAFLDSDDRWRPQKLERQLALHSANPHYRWSYTGYQVIDATGNKIERPGGNSWRPRSGWILEWAIALDVNIALPAVMAERAFLLETGGFDESFLSAEDYELWFRLAERSECGVVDEPLLDVRVHRDRSIPQPEQCLNFVRIYRNLAQRASDPTVRSKARTMQAYRAVDATGMLATLERWSEARAALMIALRTRPAGPFVYKTALRLAWQQLHAVLGSRAPARAR
jgi:glycosyltransferase involved in cell wall biosynthesis